MCFCFVVVACLLLRFSSCFVVVLFLIHSASQLSNISLQSQVKMRAYATLQLLLAIHVHAHAAFLRIFHFLSLYLSLFVLNECVNILNLLLNIALLETIKFSEHCVCESVVFFSCTMSLILLSFFSRWILSDSIHNETARTRGRKSALLHKSRRV